MALGAHKARAQAVVAAAGRRACRAGEVLRSRRPARPSRRRSVVKPVDADNSLGRRRWSATPAGLRRPRWPTAFAHSDEVLVETLRRARPRGPLRHPRARRRAGLPAAGGVRRRRRRKPIRDHADKIAPGRRRRPEPGGQGRRPGPGSSTRTTRSPSAVWEAARRCHVALGLPATTACSTSGSTPTAEPWFLEAGLYCSFARAERDRGDGRRRRHRRCPSCSPPGRQAAEALSRQAASAVDRRPCRGA